MSSPSSPSSNPSSPGSNSGSSSKSSPSSCSSISTPPASLSSSSINEAVFEVEIFLDHLDDVWAKVEVMEKRHKAETTRLEKKIRKLEGALARAMKQLEEKHENDVYPEIGFSSSTLWQELAKSRVRLLMAVGREHEVRTAGGRRDAKVVEPGGMVASGEITCSGEEARYERDREKRGPLGKGDAERCRLEMRRSAKTEEIRRIGGRGVP